MKKTVIVAHKCRLSNRRKTLQLIKNEQRLRYLSMFGVKHSPKNNLIRSFGNSNAHVLAGTAHSRFVLKIMTRKEVADCRQRGMEVRVLGKASSFVRTPGLTDGFVSIPQLSIGELNMGFRFPRTLGTNMIGVVKGRMYGGGDGHDGIVCAAGGHFSGSSFRGGGNGFTRGSRNRINELLVLVKEDFKRIGKRMDEIQELLNEDDDASNNEKDENKLAEEVSKNEFLAEPYEDVQILDALKLARKQEFESEHRGSLRFASDNQKYKTKQYSEVHLLVCLYFYIYMNNLCISRNCFYNGLRAKFLSYCSKELCGSGFSFCSESYFTRTIKGLSNTGVGFEAYIKAEEKPFIPCINGEPDLSFWFEIYKRVLPCFQDAMKKKVDKKV